MTKRITIIFGGTFGLYLQVFKEIEKAFNCVINRISLYKLKTKIKNTDVTFYICTNPIRDKNYYLQKKYFATSQWKELMPPPANEIVKKVKKSDIVLFFGYCGTFIGKKSVYTPEIFKEIFFDINWIMEIDELKMKVKNEIKIKNILRNVIHGENARVITSNITLAPYHAKPESKDKLIKIANILFKEGDVVEKETYQIAKYFRNKSPLGIYIQSSDVLTNKRHMLSHKGIETNKSKFNKNVIKSIKFALSELK
jgi:hypothetical protein